MYSINQFSILLKICLLIQGYPSLQKQTEILVSGQNFGNL